MKNVVLALLLLFFTLDLCAKPQNPSPEPFRIGVYMSDTGLAATAMRSGADPVKFIDRHFRLLKDNGVSLIVLSVQKEDWLKTFFLPELKKHSMNVILKISRAHFTYEWRVDGWSESTENKRSKIAGDFIGKYRTVPQVIAFSVREEIPEKHVNDLLQYYTKILNYAPKARIFTLHSNLRAADEQDAFANELFGYEFYPFRCGGSGKHPASLPDNSLAQFRKNAAAFRKIAAKHGPPMILAVTANAWMSGKYDIRKIDKKDKNAQLRLKEILKYAENRQFGWNRTKFDGRDYYWHWNHYRPPENCTRAMIWTAVLNGAKTVLFKTYDPALPERKSTPGEEICKRLAQDKDRNDRHYRSWITLAGFEGVPNPQLEEFLSTSKEIMPYAKLLGSLSQASDCPVSTDEKQLAFCNAFEADGISGHVIIVHNADVGKAADAIQIDDDGNLTGFLAKKDARPVKILLKNTQLKLFRCDSGAELIPDANGVCTLNITPGGGMILFVGTLAEFKKLCLIALPRVKPSAGKTEAEWD